MNDFNNIRYPSAGAARGATLLEAVVAMTIGVISLGAFGKAFSNFLADRQYAQRSVTAEQEADAILQAAINEFRSRMRNPSAPDGVRTVNDFSLRLTATEGAPNCYGLDLRYERVDTDTVGLTSLGLSCRSAPSEDMEALARLEPRVCGTEAPKPTAFFKTWKSEMHLAAAPDRERQFPAKEESDLLGVQLCFRPVPDFANLKGILAEVTVLLRTAAGEPKLLKKSANLPLRRIQAKFDRLASGGGLVIIDGGMIEIQR